MRQRDVDGVELIPVLELRERWWVRWIVQPLVLPAGALLLVALGVLTLTEIPGAVERGAAVGNGSCAAAEPRHPCVERLPGWLVGSTASHGRRDFGVRWEMRSDDGRALAITTGPLRGLASQSRVVGLVHDGELVALEQDGRTVLDRDVGVVGAVKLGLLGLAAAGPGATVAALITLSWLSRHVRRPRTPVLRTPQSRELRSPGWLGWLVLLPVASGLAGWLLHSGLPPSAVAVLALLGLVVTIGASAFVPRGRGRHRR